MDDCRPRAIKMRARPSTPSSSRSAKRRCGSRRSTSSLKPASKSSRASSPTMRQKRETLQQEAAQAHRRTCRPGRAAARRGGGLPAHRPPACRSRAPRAWRSSSSAHRPNPSANSASAKAPPSRSSKQELTALRARSHGAGAESRCARRRNCGINSPQIETQLKTARAAIDQLREDRGDTRQSKPPSCKSDLEHLEASCLTEVNVEAAGAARR